MMFLEWQPAPRCFQRWTRALVEHWGHNLWQRLSQDELNRFRVCLNNYLQIYFPFSHLQPGSLNLCNHFLYSFNRKNTVQKVFPPVWENTEVHFIGLFLHLESSTMPWLQSCLFLMAGPLKSSIIYPRSRVGVEIAFVFFFSKRKLSLTQYTI